MLLSTQNDDVPPTSCSVLSKTWRDADSPRITARRVRSCVFAAQLVIRHQQPLPCGGQPSPAARTLAVLHHHTGDAASLASTLGGEAVDVRASSGAPAHPPRDPSAGCPFRETTRGGVINALSAN
jgi:hypothetical protein